MDFFHNLKNLVSNEAQVLSSIMGIIRLEARLAKLSIYPLLINLGVLALTVFGLWISLMLFLGYLTAILLNSTFAGILSILFLHIVLFLLLIKYLLFNLKSMSFEKTREIFSKNRAYEYEKLEKEDNSGH